MSNDEIKYLNEKYRDFFKNPIKNRSPNNRTAFITVDPINASQKINPIYQYPKQERKFLKSDNPHYHKGAQWLA